MMHEKRQARAEIIAVLAGSVLNERKRHRLPFGTLLYPILFFVSSTLLYNLGG